MNVHFCQRTQVISAPRCAMPLKQNRDAWRLLSIEFVHSDAAFQRYMQLPLLDLELVLLNQLVQSSSVLV